MSRAKLRINDAATLSNSEKAELADWLRQQADDLSLDSKDYMPEFTARYDPDYGGKR